MGRRAIPTHLHVVRGNPSKKNLTKQKEREPVAPPGRPKKPKGLNKLRSEAWDTIAAQLEDMGVLSVIDGLALERLVMCYAEIVQCEGLIRKYGRVYMGKSVTGEDILKANPAVVQLHSADTAFRQYLREFGMTPSARASLDIEPIETTNNRNKGTKGNKGGSKGEGDQAEGLDKYA